ncbi:HAD-IIB family hydrolase [Limosilactobacillus sp.]|uniref:HAD-IIB family hydrolase n=1 Tax=Limosilactobacillus sp. TaxID=2773925 RepID=UPI003F0869A2
MSIKLIATDLDGTFLRDDHTYNHRHFARVFRRLQKRGIHFVAASGSSYPRLAREFAPYRDHMSFVSQNGSVIHIGQKLVRAYPITATALARVMHVLDRFYGPQDINQLVISDPVSSYVDQQMDDHNLAIVKTFYEQVSRVPDLRHIFAAQPDHEFTKISINFAEHINLQRVAATLDQYLPASLTIENSGFNTDLIGDAHGTKRNGLALLQRHFNLRADEIVTFGDNENDLGMLAMTGQSYAMQNAHQIIRMQAGHVTAADNNHDGVLKTIDQLLKNN